MLLTPVTTTWSISPLSASALPITLAGLVTAIALMLLLPRRPWLRFLALLSFSVLGAGTIAIVLRDVLGSIQQNFAGVAAGLLLALLGSELAVLGLGSLFGRAGLIRVGSGAAARQSSFRADQRSGAVAVRVGHLRSVSAPGRHGTLLRSTAFFDGAGATAAPVAAVAPSSPGVLEP